VISKAGNVDVFLTLNSQSMLMEVIISKTGNFDAFVTLNSQRILRNLLDVVTSVPLSSVTFPAPLIHWLPVRSWHLNINFTWPLYRYFISYKDTTLRNVSFI